jgi:pectate lyase
VDAFDVSIPPVTQYKFTSGTNPANGGTITAGGWLDAGSVVTVQATPSAGYKFAYFSGDLTGSTNPQSLTMNGPRNVVANFQALAPVLTAAVAAKANGTIAGQRVWTIRLSDTGAGPALGAQMTGVTLTQVSGTACSPAASAVSTFPVAVGDIAVGANATGAVTLSFGGCPDSTARFTAKVSFSANSGAYTGSTTINNQPK